MRVCELYAIGDCRRRLLARRDEWAAPFRQTPGADHTGRMPLDGRPKPEIEPDPGLERGRPPLWLARQFARVLEATPAVVEPWDPLPSAFGWTLTDLLAPGGIIWPREMQQARLGGAPLPPHAGVNMGMPGHFVPDLGIGLRLGWNGLLAQLRSSQARHQGESHDYLAALEQVMLAAQAFIRRHAESAERQAGQAQGRAGAALTALAAACRQAADAPPRTFHEAMVWLALFMTLNRAYNGQNTLGRLDLLLEPFYQADLQAGRLDVAEARFLLQALLIHDTYFICLGGTDAEGRDTANAVSRLVLEAWSEIRGPANLGVRWSENMNPALRELALRVLRDGREGVPSLVNDDAIVPGLAAAGFPLGDARQYAYGGCHWWGIPGRQYGLADGTKINLLGMLQDAVAQLLTDGGNRSTARLWELFAAEINQAFIGLARLYAVQLDGPARTLPELFQSPFCHGPVEAGRDLLDGGLEHNAFVADAMGLANVADAFTALRTVVEEKRQFTWDEVGAALAANFAAPHQPVQAALLAAPKFGNGEAVADSMAVRVKDVVVAAARAAWPADGRFVILPGFYSWIVHAWLAEMPASPDGRARGVPVAQGANPGRGQALAGPTAVAAAVAQIQCGLGAAAPLHLELSPALAESQDGAVFAAFVATFFRLGGTQLNLNVVGRQTLEAALATPEPYRDLTVRVTGFSAYFVNLLPDIQQELAGRTT